MHSAAPFTLKINSIIMHVCVCVFVKKTASERAESWVFPHEYMRFSTGDVGPRHLLNIG